MTYVRLSVIELVKRMTVVLTGLALAHDNDPLFVEAINSLNEWLLIHDDKQANDDPS